MSAQTTIKINNPVAKKRSLRRQQTRLKQIQLTLAGCSKAKNQIALENMDKNVFSANKPVVIWRK